MDANIKFAKVKEGATVPSKRNEDAGFDIYACFVEDYIELEPHETKLIPTGIASVCDEDYCFILRERGSGGSKGIALRAGIIDSGYRNEWFVGLTNTTDNYLFLSKLDTSNTVMKSFECDITTATGIVNSGSAIVYPYKKAIAQALVIPVPHTSVEEISYEELMSIKSERGMGALGSSNK